MDHVVGNKVGSPQFISMLNTLVDSAYQFFRILIFRWHRCIKVIMDLPLKPFYTSHNADEIFISALLMFTASSFTMDFPGFHSVAGVILIRDSYRYNFGTLQKLMKIQLITLIRVIKHFHDSRVSDIHAVF